MCTRSAGAAALTESFLNTPPEGLSKLLSPKTFQKTGFAPWGGIAIKLIFQIFAFIFDTAIIRQRKHPNDAEDIGS